MMNNQKSSNVILTGFRGTGKTTVGKILATRLQWVFVDMDEQLTQRLGASIAEVVARHGWAFFRQEEARLLLELQAMRCTVLATGGGAIEHQQEWQQLRNCGYVVWLDADISTIRRRLMTDPVSAQQRPSLTGQAVQDEIGTLLERRMPLYRAGSDLRLATDDKEPEELANQILRAVELNKQPLHSD
jgi:shikimate kinase